MGALDGAEQRSGILRLCLAKHPRRRANEGQKVRRGPHLTQRCWRGQNDAESSCRNCCCRHRHLATQQRRRPRTSPEAGTQVALPSADALAADARVHPRPSRCHCCCADCPRLHISPGSSQPFVSIAPLVAHRPSPAPLAPRRPAPCGARHASQSPQPNQPRAQQCGQLRTRGRRPWSQQPSVPVSQSARSSPHHDARRANPAPPATDPNTRPGLTSGARHGPARTRSHLLPSPLAANGRQQQQSHRSPPLQPWRRRAIVALCAAVPRHTRRLAVSVRRSAGHSVGRDRFMRACIFLLLLPLPPRRRSSSPAPAPAVAVHAIAPSRRI